MAAPVIAAQGAFIAYSGGTSLAIPVPSGVVVGSKIVVHVVMAWNTNTVPTSAAVTAASGFTLSYGMAFTDASDTYVVWEGWYEKTATAADTGTYTFTGGTVGTKAALALGGIALRITGAADPALGSTLQSSPVAMDIGSGSFTIPSYTPPKDNCLLLTRGTSFAATSSPTYPTGWTALGTANGSGAGGMTLSDLAQTTAVATGTTTWKVTSSDYAWGTMATVLPAVTAANVSVTAAVATATGAAASPAVTVPSPNVTVAATTATATCSALAPGITTANPTAPTITATTLNTVRQGTAFTQTIAASGSPTSWAVVAGSLPAGLALNASTGAITGTPTGHGLTYSFTLRASNAAGSDDQAFTGNILMSSETSRTTASTTGGTAYTKVVGTLGSDGWVGYFPSNMTTGVNFLMWNHPYQSPYDADIAGTGDSGWTFTLTSWLLDHGIAIASSNDAGDLFGTGPVMAAEDALFGQVNNFFTVSRLVVYGESMGGAACLNWTARNNHAPLVGAMLISGVCDTSKFTSYFTYDAAYNPMLTTPSDWTGLPIFLASSPSDSTVLETENADPFVTHVAGYATTTHIETTGGHLTSGNYPVANMESWWTAAFTGTVANASVAATTATAQSGALVPGVSTVANATVVAEAATSTAGAENPAIAATQSVVVDGSPATGSGAAHAPSLSSSSTVTVQAEPATATGQANQPSTAVGGNVTIGVDAATATGAALPAALAATRNVSVIALTAYATARALACLVNPSPVVTVTSGLNIVGVPARAGIVKLQKGGRIAWL